MMDLKPYPAMKDSGVEWLGEVPEHWEVRRLKGHVANIVDQTSDRGADEIYVTLEHVESWTGRIREAGPDVSLDSQVKRFQVEDVLFGKLRPYLAKVTRYFYKPQPAHRGGDRSRTEAEGGWDMNGFRFRPGIHIKMHEFNTGAGRRAAGEKKKFEEVGG